MSALPASILRLVKDGPERRALDAGEVDAVIDAANGNVVLLPLAKRALSRAASSAANSLLAAVPRQDYQRLLPELEPVTLTYGEVLMGTLRWEKEDEERGKTLQRRAQFDHKRRELQVSETDTRARIKGLEHDLERQRSELALYSSDNEARIVSSSEREKELRRIRSADPAKRNGSNGSRK